MRRTSKIVVSALVASLADSKPESWMVGEGRKVEIPVLVPIGAFGRFEETMEALKQLGAVPEAADPMTALGLLLTDLVMEGIKASIDGCLEVLRKEAYGREDKGVEEKGSGPAEEGQGSR